MVLLLQRLDALHERSVVAGQQARENVAFLVFVVLWGGGVEIAQDVGGGFLCLRIGTVGGDVLKQPLEQAAAFMHPLVTGVKQAGGIVKTGGGRKGLRVERLGQGNWMHADIVADFR
jgi:hypothetical protein